MTLTALSLTEAKYAWVVKPVEPDEVMINRCVFNHCTYMYKVHKAHLLQPIPNVWKLIPVLAQALLKIV